MEYFQAHLDVNYLGPIRVTKAALPLLKTFARAGKGLKARVVNINSTSGLLPGLAMKAGYGASKHASESWSNSFRQEMRPFGIEVTTVNPSWHETRIATTPLDRMLRLFRAAPKEVQADYGEDYVVAAATDAYEGRQWVTWQVR